MGILLSKSERDTVLNNITGISTDRKNLKSEIMSKLRNDKFDLEMYINVADKKLGETDWKPKPLPSFFGGKINWSNGSKLRNELVSCLQIIKKERGFALTQTMNKADEKLKIHLESELVNKVNSIGTKNNDNIYNTYQLKQKYKYITDVEFVKDIIDSNLNSKGEISLNDAINLNESYREVINLQKYKYKGDSDTEAKNRFIWHVMYYKLECLKSEFYIDSISQINEFSAQGDNQKMLHSTAAEHMQELISSGYEIPSLSDLKAQLKPTNVMGIGVNIGLKPCDELDKLLENITNDDEKKKRQDDYNSLMTELKEESLNKQNKVNDTRNLNWASNFEGKDTENFKIKLSYNWDIEIAKKMKDTINDLSKKYDDILSNDIKNKDESLNNHIGQQVTGNTENYILNAKPAEDALVDIMCLPAALNLTYDFMDGLISIYDWIINIFENADIEEQEKTTRLGM